MRKAAVLLLLPLIFLLGGPASAADAVRLSVERQAPLTGVLARGKPLYMEVVYDADQPIRLQARATQGGQSLDRGQAMNASVAHPAGHGRALVWVSYSQAAQPDQIVITAYTADWKPLSVLSLPAPVWLDEAARVWEDPPAWVQALIDEEKEIRDATPAPRETAWDAFLGMLLMLAVPGYFVLQLVAMGTLKGGWRLAALVPVVPMVPLVGWALMALAAGSNLWPLMVILAAPFCFFYLVGLYVARTAVAVARG
jgi:hypothetical protein